MLFSSSLCSSVIPKQVGQNMRWQGDLSSWDSGVIQVQCLLTETDTQQTWVCVEMESCGVWPWLDAGGGIWSLTMISSNLGRAQKWCQWYYPGLVEVKWNYLHSRSLEGQACFCLLMGVQCWCPSCICPEVPLVFLLGMGRTHGWNSGFTLLCPVTVVYWYLSR